MKQLYIMNRNFKNRALQIEFDSIINNIDNIVTLFKGDLSDNSIEIIFEEPPSTCSFTYYGKEAQRDLDFELLNKLIVEKI